MGTTCDAVGGMSSPSQSDYSDTQCSPRGCGSLLDTPTRKNKRKLSEPKRRSDFSIKRFCPESPGSVSDSIASDDMDRCRENPPETPENSASPDPVDFSVRDLPCVKDRLTPPNSRTSLSLSPSSSPSSSTASDYRYPAPVHPAHHHPPHPHPSHLFRVPPPHLPVFFPGHFAHSSLMSARNGGRFPNTNMSASSAYSDYLNPCDDERTARAARVPNSDAHALANVTATDTNGLTGAYEEASEDDDDDDGSEHAGRRPRKNYKNMTRERRVEANARERSRVHTISAAFEALRRAVPSYSYNQKLSKLAILRIACTYIMALGRLADVDYSNNSQNDPSFADCVDMCTQTIQTEGRARRRH